MAINLEKGQVLNLSKDNGVNPSQGVVLGLGFAAKSGSVDLDSWVSVMDSTGKVIDFICYKNLKGKGIKHNGDDQVGGGNQNTPNETIDLDFSKLPKNAHKVILGNSIYSGADNLGNLKWAFTNLTQSGNEIARFNMKDNYSKARTVLVGEFRNSDSGWKFKSSGDGLSGDFHEMENSYGNINSILNSPSNSNNSNSSNTGGGLFGALGRIFGS